MSIEFILSNFSENLPEMAPVIVDSLDLHFSNSTATMSAARLG
jgi:hypothetical protein